MDLVVVYTGVGGGHKAAALAVVEAARRRGLAVEAVDTFDHAPAWVESAYLGAHLTGQNAVPELYGRGYFAANRRGGAFEPVRRGADHVLFGGLVRAVVSRRPRAVIATHHLPLVVLGRARRKGWLDAPLLGVVTDYTSHACWAEPGVDAFAVPCARAASELRDHGVPRSKVATTGIPVRRAFEDVPRLAAPGRDEPVRVLVTSGGFGVGPVESVVRAFAALPKNTVSLTVVCGSSPRMFERVHEVAATAGLAATILGFERDMPRRFAEAHVVVGKAGGLTVSEALTSGRPLVIVGAVPGNEALNEAFVVEGGAGVAVAPDASARTVLALAQLGALETMGLRARGLVRRGAADAVLDCALGLGRPVRGARTSVAGSRVALTA